MVYLFSIMELSTHLRNTHNFRKCFYENPFVWEMYNEVYNSYMFYLLIIVGTIQRQWTN